MTPLRWIVVLGLVGLFLFAKVWVFRHPTGMIAIIVGAALLILTESTNAGTLSECKLTAIELGQ